MKEIIKGLLQIIVASIVIITIVYLILGFITFIVTDPLNILIK